MSSSQLRPLAPHNDNDRNHPASSNPPPTNPPPNPEPRRPAPEIPVSQPCRARKYQVLAACNVCRHRKSKCDARRPRCSLCASKGLDCHYDIDEGITRATALKLENRKLSQKVQELESIIEQLQKSSLSEAIALLETIRQSSSLQQLIENMPDASSDKAVGEIDSSMYRILTVSDALTEDQSQFLNLRSLIAYNRGHLAVSSSGSDASSSALSPKAFSGGSDTPSIHEARHRALPAHREDYQELKDMSQSYTSFCAAARDMIQRGTPVEDVLGPDNVLVDVLFRGRLDKDPHSVCTWSCAVARTWDNMDLFFRLAIAYLMSRLLRWMVLPTADNYAALPDIFKPTAAQIRIPHAPCIDLAAPPVLRDALVHNFRDFTVTCQICGVDVTWPHDLKEAIIVDSHTGLITLTPRFMEHVCDERNWYFGRHLLTVFPELEGKLNCSIRDIIPPRIGCIPHTGLLSEHGVT